MSYKTNFYLLHIDWLFTQSWVKHIEHVAKYVTISLEVDSLCWHCFQRRIIEDPGNAVAQLRHLTSHSLPAADIRRTTPHSQQKLVLYPMHCADGEACSRYGRLLFFHELFLELIGKIVDGLDNFLFFRIFLLGGWVGRLIRCMYSSMSSMVSWVRSIALRITGRWLVPTCLVSVKRCIVRPHQRNEQKRNCGCAPK